MLPFVPLAPMTPDRWEQVQSLFHEALDLHPSRRAALLRHADAEVRAEVEAMLAADTDLPPVFGAERASGAEKREESIEGYQVGPYRLVRELGVGGMGAVYLARREDVGKDVALKLVKGALAAPDVVERFMLERRVLARLDHPNVARLLDAGVADEGPLGGTPYFAMEYVAGTPITEFADIGQLDLEARIELFSAVCEAVHYAHQHLVIHRDLKPSNVLVGEDEHGAPQVKLLDFGIAKPMEEDEDMQSAGLTRTGLRIMTPEYAAPEQVRGEEVTTATDVYALGVLLFELLTGQRPYDLADRSPGEVERLICGTDVPRPSSLLAPELPGVGRSTLRQQLQGDLDAILLKALEKEPGRRYASAEALADDLRRHLEGRPVEARPQTGLYRLKKLVKRNRRGVGLAAALLVGLVALVGFFTLRLAQERDVARTEAEKAEQVSAFLVNLFSAADPFGQEEVRTDTMTAPALLARGAARLDTALADQPDVQGELFHQIGTAYERMGRFDEAERVLQRALTLRRAHLAPDHPDIPYTIKALGDLAVAQADYERAEALYRESFNLQRKIHGETHHRVAASLDGIGTALRYQGRFQDADSLYTRALAIERLVHGDDHTDVTAILGHLAYTKVDLGEHEAARELYKEVLGRTEAHLGREHPATLAQLNNFGTYLLTQERYDEAEVIFRDLVARNRAVLGAEHPRVAFALINLGTVLRDQEEYADAELVYREAVALGKRALGAEHEHVAASIGKLGVVIHEQGRSEEALPLLREALALHTEHMPRGHWQIARSQGNLALGLIGLGRYAEAERLLMESQRTLESTFPPDHYVVRESAERLALLYETTAARRAEGR